MEDRCKICSKKLSDDDNWKNTTNICRLCHFDNDIEDIKSRLKDLEKQMR